MSDSSSPSKAARILHWVAFVFLFLMIAQPTVDNIRALMSGALVMGELSIPVTPGKMALHLLAMGVGWVGLVLFFRKKKLGAYVSIGAHTLGLVATVTQTPEMFDVMPPAVVGVFFVVLVAITLGPVLAFKDQYT